MKMRLENNRSTETSINQAQAGAKKIYKCSY